VPIAEIAGELLGGIFRLLGSFLVDVVLEILIKGLGYVLCRPFSKRVNPDGIVVSVAGVVGWLVIICGLYFSAIYVAQQIEIDSCLDNGGTYNYDAKKCARKNA